MGKILSGLAYLLVAVVFMTLGFLITKDAYGWVKDKIKNRPAKEKKDAKAPQPSN